MISIEDFMILLYKNDIDTEVSLSQTIIQFTLLDINTRDTIVSVEGDTMEECLEKALLNCIKYARIFNRTLSGSVN